MVDYFYKSNLTANRQFRVRIEDESFELAERHPRRPVKGDMFLGWSKDGNCFRRIAFEAGSVVRMDFIGRRRFIINRKDNSKVSLQKKESKPTSTRGIDMPYDPNDLHEYYTPTSTRNAYAVDLSREFERSTLERRRREEHHRLEFIAMQTRMERERLAITRANSDRFFLGEDRVSNQ